MRITYRTLRTLMNRMTEEQLNSDLTVEIHDGENTECFAAELRICRDNHDSLDDGHPVFFVDMTRVVDEERREDINQIAVDIGLTS